MQGERSLKSLVLAAGRSTRLAAVAGGAPKPLVPVGGVPVLHRNLRWLASHGISETYVNLHYGADEIKASVGDGSAFGLRVKWSEEHPILGTAGAAKKLERELCSGPLQRFLVVYGDNVFGFDLGCMLDAHTEARFKDPTVAGTLAVFDQQRNPHTGIAGGRVQADAANRIAAFVEGQPDAPGYVNAGCYVLEAETLMCVPPPPQASDWARDVFPAMLLAGMYLRAYPIEGYCLGIDTPEAYRKAEEIIASLKP